MTHAPSSDPTRVALSGRRLALACLSALVVAVLLLLIWILPAEYGVDLTGLGKRLGLTALSTNAPGNNSVANHRIQAQSLTNDRVQFALSPFASVEYKYELAANAALVYQWQATGEVVFDLHAEPEGAAEDDAVSYVTGRGTSERGIYHATFTGIHGWFWENRGAEEVTVTLQTSGFFNTALHYEGGFVNRLPLGKPPID